MPEKILEHSGGKMPHLQAGYIIQSKSHRQTVTTKKETVNKPENRGPDHLAVIARINSDGSAGVAEQHVGSKKKIQAGKVWLVVRSEMEDLIKVSGTAWVCKPKL